MFPLNERTNMKASTFNLIKTALTGTLVLVLAAVVTLPLRSSADTIKAAQLQLQLSHTAIVPVSGTADAAAAMSCPQCKDKVVVLKTMAGKGAFEKVSTTSRHLCPTCRNSVKTTGHGKETVSRTIHTCTANGATGCAAK